MKVAFINRMMGIAWGGGENYVLNMARALERLGCEVQFVVGRRLSRLDLPLTQFRTTYIRTPYLRCLTYWADTFNQRLLSALGARAAKLDYLLFELACMHYIAHSPIKDTDIFQLGGAPRLASWLEKRLNKPAVAGWPGPPGSSINKWLGKYSANIARGDSIRQMNENVPGVVDIPYGVDPVRFRPYPEAERSSLRQKIGIHDDQVVVLFVGRLIAVKNLPFLINAFAAARQLNSNLRLVLVGEGKSKPLLDDLVNKLDIYQSVTFTGAQYGDDLIRWYNAADIFVICSHYESFSAVTLEAMACGLPIIASKVGYLPQLVETGVNGLLVEPDATMELRDAILELASDQVTRKIMGQANRTTIKKYSWEKSARKLISLYEEILKR